MRKTHLAYCARSLCLLLMLLLAVPALGDDKYPKISPFEALRFGDEGPEVMIGGNWFVLLAIEGVPTKQLHDFAWETYGDRARKRLGEDFVQLMAEAGHPLEGDTVTLLVRSVAGGPEMEFNDVPMTPSNRQRIWQANQDRQRAEAESEERATARKSREHSSEIPEQFMFLTQRISPTDARETDFLTPQEAAEDLDQLEFALEEQYSYLHRNNVDYRGALDAIRASLGDGIRVDDFAFQIQMMLGLFGDGHTRVPGVSRGFLPGALPFFIERSGNQIIAVNAQRNDFVDPDHPVLLAIDGKPIDQWLSIASQARSAGSTQLVDLQARQMAVEVATIRQLIGEEPRDEVDITLGSIDGGSEVQRTVTLLRSPLRGTRFDQLETKIRPDNIAYLRLERMDEAQLQEIIGLMSSAQETRGLIVDVRGNGGGSRQPLATFHEFLRGDREPPQVINIAAYRLSDAFEKNHLAARSLYVGNDPKWTGPERASIGHTMPGFKPQMELPQGQFSPWHYFVLGAGNREAWAYQYRQPIVVLHDEGSFSATDIFLGAMKDRENVLLVGTASGGGSGRTQRVRLANSNLSVLMSSMASFRRRGQLYDGQGIEPDVIVLPEPSDFVGTGDSQLDAAVELIRRRQRWPVTRPRYRPNRP